MNFSYPSGNGITKVVHGLKTITAHKPEKLFTMKLQFIIKSFVAANHAYFTFVMLCKPYRTLTII